MNHNQQIHSKSYDVIISSRLLIRISTKDFRAFWGATRNARKSLISTPYKKQKGEKLIHKFKFRIYIMDKINFNLVFVENSIWSSIWFLQLI